MDSSSIVQAAASRTKTASSLRAHGITLRAMLLGLILVPVLCQWTLYSEIVAQSTELAVLSLSIGVVFVLLVLLLVNIFLHRWFPRLALTRAELLFVYVMQTTSLPISGVGMMQFLNVGLANIFWYASPENGWANRYFPLLRKWAFPDATRLRGYYLGETSLFARGHFLAWLAPMLAWSAFIVVLLGVMLCLNVILRRRWVEQERLSFPITALPLELTRQESGPGFFRNKLMWGGFVIAFSLELLAGIGYLFPSVPHVPLKASESSLLIPSLFDAAPWNALGEWQFSFYPLVIGLTYLLPIDVSFSCWFCFFLRKLEDVGATAAGYHDPGASATWARFPYTGEQGGGAFLAFSLFSLWSMRGYLKEVVRMAWKPERGKEEQTHEPMSYRWALLGLAAGFALLVGFACSLGLAAPLAVLFFLLYLLVVITYTRFRAEAGLPWVFGPDMTPHQMLTAVFGTESLSLNSLVALTQFQWLDLDYRCTLMPHQLEAFKIMGDARLNPRHGLLAIALATVLGTVSAWIAVLLCYYTFGAATAHVDNWRTSMGSTPWYLLDSWTNSPSGPDWSRLGGMGAGALVTGLLMLGRARFNWWPFHPIGYVLSGTFTMPWLWCPMLLGWLIKTSVIRYGGMRVYRFLLPFFIGLILGDYVAGSLWAIFGCVTGVQTYKVAPI